jgi:hypothetical protein
MPVRGSEKWRGYWWMKAAFLKKILNRWGISGSGQVQPVMNQVSV